MKKFLGTNPLYVFLIAPFFVLHGYFENFGYIAVGQTLLLAGMYCAGALLTFLLFLAIYRDRSKAALAAGFILSVYFFFGAFHDLLKEQVHPLAHYSLLLSALGLTAIVLLFWLGRTKRKFTGLQLFLNSLFLVYILVDLAGIINRSFQKDQDTGRAIRQQKMGYVPYAGTTKPDIYFLLFDAYTSSLALKEKYHFDNGDFDRFLLSEGFHIQRQSRSNYQFTFFSMPSMLNMSYVPGLEIKRDSIELRKYLTDLVRDNEFTAFLHRQGYEIVNCSIFDLQGNPSPVDESLLPIKTRLITEQTLYSRVMKDLGFHFLPYFRNTLLEKELYRSRENDNRLISLVKSQSAVPAARPRFVYGHFNFPHPPYYYDSLGNPRRVVTFYSASDENDWKSYIDYLTYTNARAEELVRTIKKNTGGRAVIVLMGDHGLRYHTLPGPPPLYQLQNQNAVYFPGKDYHLFYDSISAVNQFRVVLNSLFGQNLPLLKDSTVELK